MISDPNHEPIAELRAVRVDELVDAPLDLRIGSGGLTILSVGNRTRRNPLADCLQGITAPLAGEVRFEGQTWEGRSTRETEAARLRIGRVFNTATAVSSWVQNLNVTDNVLLAQRFRRGSDDAGLRQRAEALAKRFGLTALPSSRPAVTTPEELAISQWVRAFMPEPLRLLILDRPASRAPESSLPPLLGALAEARAAGTAVLWIDNEGDSGLDLDKLEADQSVTLASLGGIQPHG